MYIVYNPQSRPTLDNVMAQGVVQGLQTLNPDLQGLSDRAFPGPGVSSMSAWGDPATHRKGKLNIFYPRFWVTIPTDWRRGLGIL